MAFDPKDPDTIAAIEAAVANASSAINERLEAAEAKNSGLLDDLKKAQRELRSAKEIKPEDMTALEDRAEKAEAALADAQKQHKALTTELDKATKAFKAESAATRKLLVENGLREALAANNVANPVHQKAAMALLSGGVEVITDGDVRTAKVGDKALADFVKEWAGGEEGKHFVSAPLNGGGGAPGGAGGSAGSKTMSRNQWDSIADPLAKAEAARTHTLTD